MGNGGVRFGGINEGAALDFLLRRRGVGGDLT